MLSCGKHPCPRPCHKGPCGECKIMVNKKISCACGAVSVGPPVKCGTAVPYCDKVCGKTLPCGHKCYYKCHFGECPPCQEIIDKPCECGKTIIKGAICSVSYKCTKICNKLLPCGHRCKELCHSGSCLDLIEKRRAEMKAKGIPNVPETGCLQPCKKIRSSVVPGSCDHPCQHLCHPGTPCPMDPCPVQVKVTCPCGKKAKIEKFSVFRIFDQISIFFTFLSFFSFVFRKSNWICPMRIHYQEDHQTAEMQRKMQKPEKI